MLSYGAFVNGNSTEFKLLAPRSHQVYVVIFESAEAESGTEYPMKKDTSGVWHARLNDVGVGDYYGYRLEGPENINDPDIIIADPYSKAAATRNTYRHVAKSLIISDDFDWEGTSPLGMDPRDAVIYEMHVRDLTVHPSSGAKQPGSYLGLVDPDQEGGIAHIKSMGFNAVELLPAQDFANVEIPFRDESAPMFNTWNPYARNHWGYMTTFFFAPETYYASDGTDVPEAWNGTDDKAVREFKTMVREFHKEGIAVLMDVVYNHVSNYDWHPFKYIDREKYFRLNDDGSYEAVSGCGNDTQSEDPAMRQLIIESIKYWMTEYHIDGFRFDLAQLIDKETCALILEEARKINPDVIIIAEPWGGGYDPNGFSDIGWAAWNDQFRNGVKGQNPHDGKGFIFGEWQGGNNLATLQRYITGSLRGNGGQFQEISHSVNYLESHDDHTMGDFIRIAIGKAGEHDVISDRKTNSDVSGYELALNKLAAFYLLTSQGVPMIHEGQEWARSKVIAATGVPEERIGQIDHNSYNKDNETNWLDWNEKIQNPELVDYYRGLIKLRREIPEFRHSDPSDYQFTFRNGNPLVIYQLAGMFFVAMNGDSKSSASVTLPPGDWKLLADGKSASHSGDEIFSGKIEVPSTSGILLERK